MQIVEILTDALTLSETPIPTKVARLFLTSDVLHNSTAPVRNASRYRSHMETSLPDIFESLQVFPSALARLVIWCGIIFSLFAFVSGMWLLCARHSDAVLLPGTDVKVRTPSVNLVHPSQSSRVIAWVGIKQALLCKSAHCACRYHTDFCHVCPEQREAWLLAHQLQVRVLAVLGVPACSHFL